MVLCHRFTKHFSSSQSSALLAAQSRFSFFKTFSVNSWSVSKTLHQTQKQCGEQRGFVTVNVCRLLCATFIFLTFCKHAAPLTSAEVTVSSISAGIKGGDDTWSRSQRVEADVWHKMGSCETSDQKCFNMHHQHAHRKHPHSVRKVAFYHLVTLCCSCVTVQTDQKSSVATMPATPLVLF